MEQYPQAYIDFLIHFHGDRDFFECHEVLEEYWKEAGAHPLADAYVGLIQLAVGLYHQRRGNLAGAAKMLRSSLDYLEQMPVDKLGLDPELLQALIGQRLHEVESGGFSYIDLNLPIRNLKLLKASQTECQERGLEWGKSSDLSDKHLLDKHKLRDRSDVIRERARQLESRKLRRGEDGY
ncbi:DUF309 domain-containing protein [Paenibacillus lutrae]|uniref:DUF309 domain-containing protein n=1 Tax=Paenibacillus lutrae TaxID=2078573 RepID=A0A7X3FIU0_9BACL|nr:DUF309 domain-containing protein [Paenibacillus lutrae]MVP00450.1 DUF309 domain-containing protein [Paenibacillus lutrae]